MGIKREFNPLMVTQWHNIHMPLKASDFNEDRYGYTDTKAYRVRVNEAIEWCEGEMIHGRFAAGQWAGYGGLAFYFKNKKDAMLFKLSWGGE